MRSSLRLVWHLGAPTPHRPPMAAPRLEFASYVRDKRRGLIRICWRTATQSQSVRRFYLLQAMTHACTSCERVARRVGVAVDVVETPKVLRECIVRSYTGIALIRFPRIVRRVSARSGAASPLAGASNALGKGCRHPRQAEAMLGKRDGPGADPVQPASGGCTFARQRSGQRSRS